MSKLRNILYELKEVATAVVKAPKEDKVQIAKDLGSAFKYAAQNPPDFILIQYWGEHKKLIIKVSNTGMFYAAGALEEHPSTALVNDGTETFILINESFCKLSNAHQRAILDHEYGHHVLGHLKISKGARTLDHELEADAYSASLGNDMVGALKALAQCNTMLRNSKELDIRIKLFLNNRRIAKNNYSL